VQAVRSSAAVTGYSSHRVLSPAGRRAQPLSYFRSSRPISANAAIIPDAVTTTTPSKPPAGEWSSTSPATTHGPPPADGITPPDPRATPS